MNFGQGKVSESQGISFQTKSGHPERSRDGCVAHPRDAMGLSVVCDCGIS